MLNMCTGLQRLEFDELYLAETRTRLEKHFPDTLEILSIASPSLAQVITGWNALWAKTANSWVETRRNVPRRLRPFDID